jgi:cyclophilin family peptidyl-prolyl cis-trans isomerase
MLFRRTLSFAILCAATVAAQAQDPPAETPPATEATTETPAATPAAEESTASLQEFDTMYTEWVGIVEKMRAMQLEWKSAKPDRRSEIEKEFNALRSQGEELRGKLYPNAEALFKADPKTNVKAGQFVAMAGIMAFGADDYEEAARIFQVLIDSEYPNNQVYQYAGMSAFNIGSLEKASEYLQKADTEGVLDDKGKDYLFRLETFKPDWEAEQAIRAKEEAAGDLPRVRFKLENGDVVLELFENEAPNTVANFVSLVEKGFYNGTPFHRVLQGFMAQGGDPKGDGTGGPGYRIECECKNPGYRKHFRGSLSMAKETAPDTGGSQFFITFVPTTGLDGQHTVFGRVVEGMDVVSKITRRNPEEPNQPEPDKIISATVERKRPHDYKPKTLPE